MFLVGDHVGIEGENDLGWISEILQNDATSEIIYTVAITDEDGYVIECRYYCWEQLYHIEDEY
jgi:hypothetical protein